MQELGSYLAFLLTELQSQIITAFGNIEASYTTHKEKIKVIAEEAAADLRQTTTDLFLDLQTRLAAQWNK